MILLGRIEMHRQTSNSSRRMYHDDSNMLCHRIQTTVGALQSLAVVDNTWRRQFR